MPTPWAFAAQSWKRFDKNTLKLTKGVAAVGRAIPGSLELRTPEAKATPIRTVSAGVTFAGPQF